LEIVSDVGSIPTVSIFLPSYVVFDTIYSVGGFYYGKNTKH